MDSSCILPCWILLLVMAVLTLIPEVIPRQTDAWIVAVIIVEPDLVMDDFAQAVTAHLAQAAVHGNTVSYIPGSRPAP